MSYSRPEIWTSARLADVLAEPLINGRSVPTADVGFPVLRLTALKTGWIDLSERKVGAWSAADAQRYLVRAGDFLVARGNGSRTLVGRGGVVPSDPDAVAFPDTLIRVRVDEQLVDMRYLQYAWDSAPVRRQIETAARTTAGIYKINQQDLEAVNFPLPPLAEQRRIVAALEEHLSDLDAAVAGLERARANAVRYRAAVLDAAMAGALLDSRSSWDVYTVGALGEVVTGTTPATNDPSNYGGSVPFFKPTDLGAGYFVCAAREHLSASGLRHARLLPAASVLVTCIGATIGKCGLARVACATNQQINAVIPHQSRVLPEFLFWYFASPEGQRSIRENASATTLPILNKTRFSGITVRVPGVDEQCAIVAEVERRLAVADRTAAEIDVQLARAARLRQAILKRAFEGKLVPQDPDDEPASALLERIRAECSMPARASSPRRARRRSA